jgi:benzylsuccinate CoA-transferase BbsF subunit
MSEPTHHSPLTTHHSPLSGIRILDFSWVAAGPLAAKILADHGAEVILVESANRRGGLRGEEPMPPGKRGENVSGWFNFLNTNKLGITVNMKRPEGVELIRRLVAISDVVLDNYTPGVMGRWGLDYASLAAIKPDIIVMSMPVMGTTGPRRQIGGFGSTPLGLSGIHHLSQVPGRGPAECNHAYADQASNAGHGAVALLAALLYRRRTGRGQFIDLAQFESTANFAGPYLLEYLATGVAQPPAGNHAPEAAPHNAYRCADEPDGTERWCVIAVGSDAEWQALRTALGDPAWVRDPRYATLAGRKAHEEELDRHLATWTAERSPEEVMALLQTHGVAAGVVQDGRDLLDRDPHLRERGYFFTMDHPEMGPSRYHRLAFTLSATPAQFRPAPLLGQHNHYVLSTLLGLSDAEIEQYEKDGVLE